MDGVGVCVENYSRELCVAGHGALVFAPATPGFEDDEPFPVVRFPSLPLPGLRPYRIGWPSLGRDAITRARNTPFTLVHSHSPFVAGRFAMRTAARKGIPHISTFHTKYRDDVVKLLKSTAAADAVVRSIVRFYDRCDAVWTPSESTARTLREYGFTGDVTIAPNGSDLTRPTDGERDALRKAGRERRGISEDSFVCLFVGQHRWEKNTALIIEGLAALKRSAEGADFVVLFAGEGVDRSGMEAMARRSGLGERARFLGKIVDRDAMSELYAASDLFLFPSVYDNAPLVMREAAGFSLPTVVASGSAAAEIIDDRVNGFVVDNDARRFAELIGALMADRDAIRTAGSAAAQSVYRGWTDIVRWAATEYERVFSRFTV
ncbi:MAG: glycosyltransferase [Spirochaetaceae bacterium]|nr:MAG: glycosyltransferase [Spirochaetaceae bacterium]